MIILITKIIILGGDLELQSTYLEGLAALRMPHSCALVYTGQYWSAECFTAVQYKGMLYSCALEYTGPYCSAECLTAQLTAIH